jgi:redox-sensitive bicupin YhaK (pirin superfamily)
MPVTIDIRRSADRFHTRTGWLDSWHSFSFADHYDATNTHHGLLLVSNDDTVAPNGGFGMHFHRDMEIVTWVLDGQLEHRDSEGNHGLLYPGLAQRMSAGTGILHSEMNPNAHESVHIVQMWVPPDTRGIVPSYEQADVSDALASGEFVEVAGGGATHTPIHIHQRDAAMFVARLAPGGTEPLPEAPSVHVFVAAGAIELRSAGAIEPAGGDALAAGDAARLTSPAGLTVTGGPIGAEVIVWATA